jgi:hypothetical protein
MQKVSVIFTLLLLSIGYLCCRMIWNSIEVAPNKLKRPAMAAHVLECSMQVALIDDADTLSSRLDRISGEESGTRHPEQGPPREPK